MITPPMNGPQSRAPLKWGEGAKNLTLSNRRFSKKSADFRRSCTDTAQALRIGTWNVGSMNRRSGEVADALARRNIDICCVQESRWKGAGTKILVKSEGCISSFGRVALMELRVSVLSFQKSSLTVLLV